MMNRRKFLHATGIALGVPALPSLSPLSRAADRSAGDVRRMLSICAPLGFHTPNLFPQKAGKDYEVTTYLEPLQAVRDKVTVASGLMHPMVDGGHSAERSFLTGAAHPGQPSFRNTISVDQFAAERIGHETRLPFLSLSANSRGISYTRAGVPIPANTRPSQVFKKLFLEGTEPEKETQMRRIKDGQSIMDLVRDQTQALTRRTGREDHETLDQYFTSVREVEQRLVQAEEWAQRPKPLVDAKPPTDITDRADFAGKMQLMYDLMFLALQTDSTRLITFCGAGGNEVVSLKGVEDGWHNLSHHGKDPTKIEQLTIIEREEFRLFGEFVQSESLPNVSRVLTFKLGAKGSLPEPKWRPTVVFNPPKLEATDETVRLGYATYQDMCMGCHGLNAVSGLLIPDLRGSAYLWDKEGWNSVVMGGKLRDKGMPIFADYIDQTQGEAVRAYVIQQAHRAVGLISPANSAPPQRALRALDIHPCRAKK